MYVLNAVDVCSCVPVCVPVCVYVSEAVLVLVCVDVLVAVDVAVAYISATLWGLVPTDTAALVAHDVPFQDNGVTLLLP